MSTWRQLSTQSTGILQLGQEISANSTNTTETSSTVDSNPFIFALVLQTAIILVFLGNALVLTTLSCYRHWTSADVLLFSLSLADVLDSIVALQMITVVKYYLQKPLVKQVCDVFVGLVYTFRMASATTVTFIAVERAVLVTNPFRHHTLISLSRTKKFVLGIWSFSILFSILPFIGVGRSGFHDGACFHQLYDLGKAYAILIEVYGVIMVFAVFSSYFAIKLSGKMFIRRQQTLVAGQSNDKNENRARSMRNGPGSNTRLPENTSGVRSVKKLTVMMGIVVVVYYISWLPFLLNNLFCLIVDREPLPGMILFTSLISMFHALANPPLYGWMSQRYRRGYFFVLKMALSVCGGHRPKRRSLSVSRRYCTGTPLSRQATCTEITLTNSRLSLPRSSLALIPIEEDKGLDEILNNNEKSIDTLCAHVEETQFAEQADKIAGIDNISIVSMEVIELLDAILESVDDEERLTSLPP